MTKKPAQLDREIAESLEASAPKRTYGSQWPKDRRYALVDHDTGREMRRAHDFEVDQIHASRHGVAALALRSGTYQVRLRDLDEKFTARDVRGRVIGESKSAKGAMALAPKDESYALVRGEYTSDGRYWGPGYGRVVAVREFRPTGGFRWYEG